MGYKMRLKKYMSNENEKNNPNPYQEMYDEKDGKTHEMYGMWFKVIDIGIDGFDDLPYFYIELEEVQNEHLVKCRKATGKNTRLLKAIINELQENSIEIKNITPIFNLDSDDLTKILNGDWEDREFKYLSKDKERLEKDGEYYLQDSDEIFNFLVEVRYWKKNRLVEEYFILKELEDLENLKKELNE